VITNCIPAISCQEKSRQYRAIQRQMEQMEITRKKQEQRLKVTHTLVFHNIV